MSGRLANYHPDEVLIYFLGNLIQGFADGEMVTVENMSPGFDEVVGTDGEVARSRSSDRRAKVTIKLLQTSESNKALSAAHRSDLNSPNGAGVGTFEMSDLSGFSVVSGAESWIKQYPDASYDRTAKSREWTIIVASADRTEGGN